MRPIPLLLGLGVLLTPFTVHGAPPDRTAIAHPLTRLVENERGPQLFIRRVLGDGAFGHAGSSPVLAVDPPPLSALDCVHAKHDIQLDPKTGATTAHLDLEIRAQGHALSAVGFSLDEGLHVGAVTADGRAVTVSDEVHSPERLVQLELSPALKPGESTVLHVAYDGTLACGAYDEGGIVCTKGEEFSYFGHQSVVPFIFDPDVRQGGELDAMTRDIVLRVPAGVDVIATGEKVSETNDGTTTVSTWTIDHPLSRALGMYVFAGKLGLRPVPGRKVPTTFVFPNPELPVDARLVSWSAGVLDFVEQVGGGPLPFQRSMTLVRLPANVGDPGTATFGMTLLSDSYVRAGDLMHEETWAHENSHLFWGIVVPETSSDESRMMSEGLAVLSELDYTWSRHFASMDRDTYLARRFVPIGLDLRAHGQDLPSVQLRAGETHPDGLRTSLYTLWAYYKTSATLDHLRVTVGEEAFARGLAAYVKQCSYVGCRPDSLRTVLEKTTGDSLAPFFDRWVNATSRPAVSIAFEPVDGGADIELTKVDAEPMTLELWLRLDDGQLVKRRVKLRGPSTKVHVATGARVRSVMTSPRHDVLVDARSSLKHDLDADGEVDGIDLLRCTPLVGKSYESKNAVGLFDIDERFDPRCDLNGDLVIDDEDIDAIAGSFGNLRKSP
ncbi:MAG: Aminopeptidase [Myxococcaceae bacterium]|nr:Aminopeptidase [Myxococcaceae bacterium]